VPPDRYDARSLRGILRQGLKTQERRRVRVGVKPAPFIGAYAITSGLPTIRELIGLVNTTSLQRIRPHQGIGLSNTFPQTFLRRNTPGQADEAAGGVCRPRWLSLRRVCFYKLFTRHLTFRTPTPSIFQL
jgi:hypothetical protein